MNLIVSGIRSVYTFFVSNPLWNLYLESPSIGGFGGWQGKDQSIICSTLTDVPAIHWEMIGKEQCTELIAKRFHSLVVTLCYGGYFLILIDFAFMLRSMVWRSFFSYNLPRKNSKHQK